MPRSVFFRVAPYAAAIVLATAGLGAVRAQTRDAYASWREAIDVLQAAGYSQVEEIETRWYGGFEVDTVDAGGHETELQLAGQPLAIRSKRSGHEHADADELVETAQLRAAIDWLEHGGYRDLESLSGERGGIEVEVRDAGRTRVELEIASGPGGIALLQQQRGSLLDF